MLTATASANSETRPPAFAFTPSRSPGLVDEPPGGSSLRESSARIAEPGMGRSNTATTWKVVYAIVERGPRKHWLRIGMAFVNRDGSLNVRLDAVPLSGQLHIRDNPPRDERETRDNLGEPLPPLPPLPFEREPPPLRARSRASASPAATS